MQSSHHSKWTTSGLVVLLAGTLLHTVAQAALNKPSCRPFRVYPGAHLPEEPPEAPLPMPAHWETDLPAEIAAAGANEDFVAIYERWKSSLKKIPSDLDRYRFLFCLRYYSQIDTDGDGIPDWTPVTDGMPSETLMPFDPDMDGDGIPNVLDADPLNASEPSRKPRKGEIPNHLVEREILGLQKKLYRGYGLLAVSHTDQHSKLVLQELLNVLKRGGLGNLVRRLGNLRYIYAFRGHSARGNIAAYHQGLDALSIGGITAYGDKKLSPASRILLIESLVHEIGHAFLLKSLTPQDLQNLAVKFGGWKPTASVQTNFYAPQLFAAHPTLLSSARKPAAITWDIPSSYALTNMHEWFAESFASFVMARLDKAGALPAGWQKLLNSDPSTQGDWSDYAHLSTGFTAWFESNIRYPHVEIAKHALAAARSPRVSDMGK